MYESGWHSSRSDSPLPFPLSPPPLPLHRVCRLCPRTGFALCSSKFETLCSRASIIFLEAMHYLVGAWGTTETRWRDVYSSFANHRKHLSSFGVVRGSFGASFIIGQSQPTCLRDHSRPKNDRSELTTLTYHV